MALLGDGWSPNIYNVDRAAEVRYRMNSLEVLEEGIQEVLDLLSREAGRTGAFEIQAMDLSER